MANPNFLAAANKRKGVTPAFPPSLMVALVVVVLSVLVYGVFFVITMIFDSRTNAIEDDIQGIRTEISALSDDSREAKSFVDRLDNLTALASQHTYWSGFLKDLADRTDKRVQYLTMRGDEEKNTLSFQGRAADLGSIERELVSVRSSAYVKDVSAENINYTYDPKTKISAVTFTMKFDLDPVALKEVPSQVQLKNTGAK